MTSSTWWTREQTYDSHTYGRRVGVSYRLFSRARGSARAPAGVLRVAYVHEYLRYNVHEHDLENLATVEQRIALGLDPVSGSGRGTKASIALEVERNVIDNLLDPHRGFGVSARTEFARPSLGGTFRFSEYVVDGRGYVPLGRMVFAARGRYGTLAAASDADVPFSERYFLGGSTSLRGWGRFQVAPLSRGLPVGGRTMLDLSAELRVPLRGKLGAVAFLDAGNVWAGSWDAQTGDLEHDAGLGLRYGTPIGLVRGDLGIQLTRIPGLLIKGQEETRHWRLHVSIGQAF
jgi:translocation and assembly module TamA